MSDIEQLTGRFQNLYTTLAQRFGVYSAFNQDANYGKLTLAVIQALFGELQAERDALKTEVERLTVQLAGCLTAAEGGTSEEVVATEGMYGWSLAYQATLDCRKQLDRYKAALNEEQVGPLWDRWLERLGQSGSESWSTPQLIEWLLADRRRAAFGEEP